MPTRKSASKPAATPEPDRDFPVRPNLEHLRHQAKDLLAAFRSGDASALATFRKFSVRPVDPAATTLSLAQLVLARRYGLPSWPRLVAACRMTNAIWQGDLETVRTLVLKNPRLLTEDARGIEGNWGPPMSYAANLGQDAIIAMLRDLGAQDIQFAFGRACLQGRLETARKLYAMGARPAIGSVMGPCETLSGTGLAFLLELGSPLTDHKGDRLAPLGLILQTYCRNPPGKHACLELVNTHGVPLPDTPPMAVHRGRIDLLAAHLQRDPNLLSRTFSHDEIFPIELGCHPDPTYALHGTPLAGGTLLHLCVDYDELAIAQWLLAHGASPDAPAAIDADGFGGQTPLFGCVVSQTWSTSLRRDDAFARLLLDHGANPNSRASLRKQLRFVPDESLHEFRNVTPLAWGEQFQNQDWVNRPAMNLIRERGGHS